MAKKKDRERIYRSLLILVGIVILILIFFFLGKPSLLKKQEELTMPKSQKQPQSGTAESGEEYPHNIIEGVIFELDKPDKPNPTSFILETDTSKITTAKLPSMKKTIKVTENTEFILYDMTTKKESPLKFSELEKGDFVVIGTKESAFEKVNELDEFTAAKISKFVNYPRE